MTDAEETTDENNFVNPMSGKPQSPVTQAQEGGDDLESIIDAEALELNQEKQSAIPFDPYHPWRRWWDGAVFVLIMYSIIYEPYKAAFVENKISFFDVFVDICFWADILCNFVTGYELPNGAIERDLTKIGVKYASSYFIVDLVATFPWVLLAPSSDSGNVISSEDLVLFRLLRVLRVLRIFRSGRIVSRFMAIFSIQGTYMVAIRFIFVLIFLIHFLGCLFYVVALLASSGTLEGSWAEKQGIEDDTPNRLKYMHCIYWSLTTMTTIGYGDIHPILPEEIVYSCMSEMIGFITFAYTVNNLARILARLNLKENNFREHLDMLFEFMRDIRCEPDLRGRVIQSMKVRNHPGASVYGSVQYEEELLSLLPLSLQEEVTVYKYSQLLLDSGACFNGMERNLLKTIASRVQSVFLSPTDLLIDKGEWGKILFALRDGDIRVAIETNTDIKYSDISDPALFTFGRASDSLSTSEWTAHSINYTDSTYITTDDLAQLLADAGTEEDRDYFFTCCEAVNKTISEQANEIPDFIYESTKISPESISSMILGGVQDGTKGGEITKLQNRLDKLEKQVQEGFERILTKIDTLQI